MENILRPFVPSKAARNVCLTWEMNAISVINTDFSTHAGQFLWLLKHRAIELDLDDQFGFLSGMALLGAISSSNIDREQGDHLLRLYPGQHTFALFNHEGKLIHANPAYLSLAGLSYTEALGQTVNHLTALIYGPVVARGYTDMTKAKGVYDIHRVPTRRWDNTFFLYGDATECPSLQGQVSWQIGMDATDIDNIQAKQLEVLYRTAHTLSENDGTHRMYTPHKLIKHLDERVIPDVRAYKMLHCILERYRDLLAIWERVFHRGPLPMTILREFIRSNAQAVRVVLDNRNIVTVFPAEIPVQRWIQQTVLANPAYAALVWARIREILIPTFPAQIHGRSDWELLRLLDNLDASWGVYLSIARRNAWNAKERMEGDRLPSHVGTHVFQQTFGTNEVAWEVRLWMPEMPSEALRQYAM